MKHKVSFKEYLSINSLPLLDNMMNIFILMWLEKSGMTSAAEISETTNIALESVNVILRDLYANGLAAINGDSCRITENGIELLDKFGYSDTHIQNILANTSFKADELCIYNSLFTDYRKNYLYIYLWMLYFYKKEYESTLKQFTPENKQLTVNDKHKPVKNKENYIIVIPNNKETQSLFWSAIMHEIGHYVYTDMNTNLIGQYNQLFEYSRNNYCVSSELYHDNSHCWKRSKLKDKYLNYVIYLVRSSLNAKTSEMPSSDYEATLSKLYSMLTKNSLKKDLSASSCIASKQGELMKHVFECSDITQLAEKLNISETQAKFILQSIRAKADDILHTDINDSK